MKKSIYSLVLSDEIVQKVDELSYQMRTSRSNVINQILAEHFSCVTPEMRMQTIFSGMEALMMHQFRILEQTSAHMLAMQSQLNYKYKPTVQYSVELYKVAQNSQAGKLRIQLRTQNQALLLSLEQFFKLWILLEQHYLNTNAEYQLSPGRLERSLRNPDAEESEFGELLGDYVRRFDRYLKAWFSGTPAQELETAFCEEAQNIQKFI
ncbi:MAG: hypothetical protein E7496_09655 [Ruminococcus sp.]|nr:hypothetical protein [Ruminococcus sp.]